MMKKDIKTQPIFILNQADGKFAIIAKIIITKIKVELYNKFSFIFLNAVIKRNKNKKRNPAKINIPY